MYTGQINTTPVRICVSLGAVLLFKVKVEVRVKVIEKVKVKVRVRVEVIVKAKLQTKVKRATEYRGQINTIPARICVN